MLHSFHSSLWLLFILVIFCIDNHTVSSFEFLEAISSHSRKLFSEFPYKFSVIALHDIIGLQNFSLSFCQSKSRFALVLLFLHRCYTFCTGVTRFALVLHLSCTALSKSESSNFFICNINNIDADQKALNY